MYERIFYVIQKIMNNFSNNELEYVHNVWKVYINSSVTSKPIFFHY